MSESFDKDSLDYDSDSFVNWDNELDYAASKNERRRFVKRKLEERMERKKIIYDINDYDEDFEDFNWDNYKS